MKDQPYVSSSSSGQFVATHVIQTGTRRPLIHVSLSPDAIARLDEIARARFRQRVEYLHSGAHQFRSRKSGGC